MFNLKPSKEGLTFSSQTFKRRINILISTFQVQIIKLTVIKAYLFENTNKALQLSHFPRFPGLSLYMNRQSSQFRFTENQILILQITFFHI